MNADFEIESLPDNENFDSTRLYIGQGRMHGYPSRVRVGRGSDEIDSLGSWAGAATPKPPVNASFLTFFIALLSFSPFILTSFLAYFFQCSAVIFVSPSLAFVYPLFLIYPSVPPWAHRMPRDMNPGHKAQIPASRPKCKSWG